MLFAETHSGPVRIVISENDNLYKILINQGIDVREVKDFLSLVSSKVSNNKIGYARLLTSSIDLSFIICPKIFDYDESKFLSYLEKFFSLKNKYKSRIRQFNFDDSYAAISIPSKERGELTFDRLVDLKYLSILENIENFFQKNKPEIYKREKLSLNSLEHELDPISSITDPIKSNIHQSRIEININSQLAEIALSLINKFRVSRKSVLSEVVIQKAKSIARNIKSQFGIVSVDFYYKRVLQSRVRRLFDNRQKQSLLYNLLILIGHEDFFSGDTKSEKIIEIKNTSIFFESDKLFELMVYDKLSELYETAEIKYQPSKKFRFESSSGEKEYFLQAKPDFKVTHNGKIITIDAKWKILDRIESTFVYDSLKLIRDKRVFNADVAELFYPRVSDKIETSKPHRFDLLPEEDVTIETLSL